MKFDAFISDPHFGHRNIIKYCNRPFSSVEEQTEEIIKRYNERVAPNESCLWLGDCFFGGNKFARTIMDRLNGKKFLVRGNHDPSSPFDCVSRGFEWAVDKMYVRWENKNVVLIHYDQWPFRSPWDDRYQERRHQLNMNRMEVVVHGHTHQKSKVLLNQVHVGVDAWDFGPARYEEIAPLIKNIPDDWNRDLREELDSLTSYRDLISSKSAEISDPKFDKFRSLGWEVESKMREM